MTEQPVDLCAVGGCASAGPNQVLMGWHLGEQEFDIEVSLCDYHLGWYEAYVGRVNASLVAA